MKYELAKELKEAGFEQAGKGNWFIPGYADAQYITYFDDKELCAYEPTLEELIEACGTQFGTLSNWRLGASRDPGDTERIGTITNWTATKFDAQCGIAECCPNEAGDGDTPLEAVANLWLALNRKTASV